MSNIDYDFGQYCFNYGGDFGDYRTDEEGSTGQEEDGHVPAGPS